MLLLPLGALIFVGVVMLGLGALFTILGNIGTIIVGLLITVGVPALGALLAGRKGSTGVKKT